MPSARFVVRGRVQGVGFRWFVWRQAEQLRLRGAARNLPDGSVEVLAEGSRESLDRLQCVLEGGPAAARVDHVERSEVSDEIPIPNTFEIR